MRKRAKQQNGARSPNDDEAAGRVAQAAAIKQALAHEGRVSALSPGAARAEVAAPLWILVGVAAAAGLTWIFLS